MWLSASRNNLLVLIVLTLALAPLLLAGGCASAKPRYFPSAPVAVIEADGAVTRIYEIDANGPQRVEQRIAASGRVDLIQLPGADGSHAIAWPPPTADVPHLMIILDSIPYDMVAEAWRDGSFRLFPPPSRALSPFPVMTDVSLVEFFDMAPAPGVEALYLKNGRLTGAASSYLHGSNMIWLACVDYRLAQIGHAFAYLDPAPWYEHELAKIQERGLAALREGRDFVGYVLSTSALGSKLGRAGHVLALDLLNRMCQEVVRQMDGRVHITLMSDHGHLMVDSKWISLAAGLRELGYTVGDHLGDGIDAVVPEWGQVSCVSIYTPQPERIAADVIGLEGVDLAAYRAPAGAAVVVIGKAGRAEITRVGDEYRYVAHEGDPLELLEVLRELDALDADERGGQADDAALFAATVDHKYPDAPHRLWRAFNGLVQSTPDVMVSIAAGYHAGSEDLQKQMQMQATHGNLLSAGSYGFVMSTAGSVAPVVRMEDLAEALRGLGVRVPHAPGEAQRELMAAQ